MPDGPRRRGRPVAADGEETRRQLVDVARRSFATAGYDATSIVGVADSAGLTPTAVYHYFANKEALYAAVVDASLEVWEGLLDRVEAQPTLAEQVDAYLAQADTYAADERPLSAFLVGIPVEAKRRPELRPHLERLTDWQRKVFEAMADTGSRTGELARFADRESAVSAIGLLLIGWSYETHHRPEVRAASARVVADAIEAWS